MQLLSKLVLALAQGATHHEAGASVDERHRHGKERYPIAEAKKDADSSRSNALEEMAVSAEIASTDEDEVRASVLEVTVAKGKATTKARGSSSRSSGRRRTTTPTAGTGTDYALAETPLCTDCGDGSPADPGNRANECWETCGGGSAGPDAPARGLCDKCNSAAGSRGACCASGYDTQSDPDICQLAVEYPTGDYDGRWHVCVLVETTSTTPPPCMHGARVHVRTTTPTAGTGTDYALAETPLCTGCGDGSPADPGNRANECWETCGGGSAGPDAPARGLCDKCNSAAGSRGACCASGYDTQSDPDICQLAVEYPTGDYDGRWHVCVLVETTSTTPPPCMSTTSTTPPSTTTPTPNAHTIFIDESGSDDDDDDKTVFIVIAVVGVALSFAGIVYVCTLSNSLDTHNVLEDGHGMQGGMEGNYGQGAPPWQKGKKGKGGGKYGHPGPGMKGKGKKGGSGMKGKGGW